MEILLNRVMLGMDDEPILNEKKVPFTLRDAVRQALMGVYADEQNLAGEEKVKRYDLFLAAKQPDPVSMSVEQVALAKKLVGKAFAPIVVGQAWKMLEE